VCSRETLERIVDPLIADLQFEHSQAINDRRFWHARRLLLGGYFAFWKALGMRVAAASGHAVRAWLSSDGHAIGRTLALSLVLIATLTVLLALMPLYAVQPWNAGANPQMTAVRRAGDVSSVKLFVYVIPQAIPLAIVFGLPIGILCGLRGRQVNGRVAASMLSVAVVIALVTFVVVAWIMPETNQAFRLLVTGREFLQRGDNELTLWELRARLDDWGTPVAHARSYYLRWAISFAPIVLGLFSVSLSAIKRRSSISVVTSVLASVMCVGSGLLFLLGLQASRSFASLPVWASLRLLPVWATVWLPNLIFAAMALILFVCSNRTPPRRSRP